MNFVKSLAKRFIEIMITIKIRAKMIPVGGIVSKLKKEVLLEFPQSMQQ
jgi:hypothetical protein